MESRKHRRLVLEAAETVHDAFISYNDNFRGITRRARRRFQSREWAQGQNDIAERFALYAKSIDACVVALRRVLGSRVSERALWSAIKQFYGARVNDIPDGEFSKTFFNSVSRNIFNIIGIDPEIEFVALRLDTEEHHRHLVELKTYLNWGSMRTVVARLLRDFAFDTPYTDIDADIGHVLAEIGRYENRVFAGPREVLRVEFMAPVFYQSTRAYLIGKIFWPAHSAPLIIALRNSRAGIAVDAVLMSVDSVSILFGFTRSYFLADVEPVEGAIYFLKSIIPRKPIDELYTALGRIKQGKTERYRIFMRHLEATNDSFVHAAGDRGLVMIVFTLPSYDLVFKVIRDRFGYPKNVSHTEVMKKYQFVFNHDRAGRLIDSQEFRHLEFPVDRFEPVLLEELVREAGATARVVRDQLVIDHLYIERRVRPLNLYVEEREPSAVAHAILDYGQAIKDLARSNIFPGDLLLKNFGVTRHGRVVFYDYDELCLVTECNFREIPQTPADDDNLQGQAWFYVGKNDVFPEEFIKFLSMSAEWKSLFLNAHADLLTPQFWRKLQLQHKSDEIPEVIPYFRSTMVNSDPALERSR